MGGLKDMQSCSGRGVYKQKEFQPRAWIRECHVQGDEKWLMCQDYRETSIRDTKDFGHFSENRRTF